MWFAPVSCYCVIVCNIIVCGDTWMRVRISRILIEAIHKRRTLHIVETCKPLLNCITSSKNSRSSSCQVQIFGYNMAFSFFSSSNIALLKIRKMIFIVIGHFVSIPFCKSFQKACNRNLLSEEQNIKNELDVFWMKDRSESTLLSDL